LKGGGRRVVGVGEVNVREELTKEVAAGEVFISVLSLTIAMNVLTG
jgi:hypothetical protein